MCIFSGPVIDVSATKIFCRIKEDKQILVYSMEAEFDNPVAMILPIPNKSKKEDAIDFIDLKSHADFFKDLDKPFEMRSRGISKSLSEPKSLTLKVHEVGNYLASYVPHRLFFGRLDECFRLSENVWDNLPQYNDSGFVVFQLNKTGSNHYHPMGFTFPTKHKEKLYFPTVHVHEGVVEAKGDFDHALYFQGDMEMSPLGKKVSSEPAKAYIKSDYIKSEVVDPNAFINKVSLFGVMENKDIYAQ